MRRAPTKGALRIVAGTVGGRRIDVPPGQGTRPTSDRVREALFNALESLDAVDGARVLDAFAGSGALGIEALSRGASHATFADTDPQAIEVISLDHLKPRQWMSGRHYTYWRRRGERPPYYRRRFLG